MAIAGKMFITEKAVGKHTNSIFGKLGLEQSEDDNRRVLAVIAYLENTPRRARTATASRWTERLAISPSVRYLIRSADRAAASISPTSADNSPWSAASASAVATSSAAQRI